MAIGHPHFYRTADDYHWNRLPKPLQDEVIEYVDALTDLDLGQPCIWLDLETKQCKHYEYRPQMCHDFEVGNKHCLRLREAHGLPIEPPY